LHLIGRYDNYFVNMMLNTEFNTVFDTLLNTVLASCWSHRPIKCEIWTNQTFVDPRSIQFQLNLNTNTEHVNSLNVIILNILWLCVGQTVHIQCCCCVAGLASLNQCTGSFAQKRCIKQSSDGDTVMITTNRCHIYIVNLFWT